MGINILSNKVESEGPGIIPIPNFYFYPHIMFLWIPGRKNGHYNRNNIDLTPWIALISTSRSIAIVAFIFRIMHPQGIVSVGYSQRCLGMREFCTGREYLLYGIAQFRKYDHGVQCGSDDFKMYPNFTRMQKHEILIFGFLLSKTKIHLHVLNRCTVPRNARNDYWNLHALLVIHLVFVFEVSKFNFMCLRKSKIKIFCGNRSPGTKNPNFFDFKYLVV